MIDTSSSMLYHMSNLNGENHRITYQMASGKSMENGSEDAMLHKDLISLEDNLRVTEGLKEQIEKTIAFNDISDTNVGEIKLSLDDIKADLMKALNSGTDRTDKTAIASNIEGMRETLLDRINTQVNGEYIFAGSDATKITMVEDEDYKINGQLEFEGDGFLREVAVESGSYRERGVTAYDVAFYDSDTAQAGESLTFSEGERVIDSNGNEWKFNDNSSKLQKYDYNGILIDPLVEIGVELAPTSVVTLAISEVEDGDGGDLKGDYGITIINEDGDEYVIDTATATGSGDTSASVLAALVLSINTDSAAAAADRTANITNDFPDISAIISLDGELVITSNDGSTFGAEIYDRDSNYVMTASNSVESATTQGTQNAYIADIPEEYEGTQFLAKHNYFDDLNIAINALDGYATNLNGTRGQEVSDNAVNDIIQSMLTNTTTQYDATNKGHGVLGGRNAVFESNYTSLETKETHYDLLIEEWGSADTAQLAMESSALSLTYQSLYSTIKKMNDMSLVKYL